MIFFLLIALQSRKSSKQIRKVKNDASIQRYNIQKLVEKGTTRKNTRNQEEDSADNKDEDNDSLDFIFLIVIAVCGGVLLILLVALVIIMTKMLKKRGALHAKKSKVESSNVALLNDNESRTNTPERPESNSAYVRPESNLALLRTESNTYNIRPASNAEFTRPTTAIIMPESSLEILESSSISSVDIE